ncbi:MAG: efflux RND transporter periplasmic adaptor subunit [Deltaproteobacteria bacterium]|nr:efflux RND transporter periplasmic adaptor subunit [Deltaproteobacteria bacterium]
MKRTRTTAFRSFIQFVSVIIIPMLLFTAAGCGKPETEAPPPPVVEVADVIQRDVPIYMEWVASTDGSVNAVIRPQVTGYLISQNYKEGDVVKKGQVLFRIDPRVFQSALDQANGQLAQQQARWTTAKANLKRIKPLAAQNAVSQKDLDDATGQEQSTHASVIAAQAAVDKARLDLGFTKVTSLIDGVAGIAKAQIGDLVGPGQTGELTTVSTVDPIKVYVPVSEQQYLKSMDNRSGKTGQTVLQLILSDGSTFPHKGKITFADRQIDPMTGTIKVATLFPNPGNLLRPGQFARVRAQVGIASGALLVPQRAVQDIQGNYQVAVVGPGNKVDIRPVEVGERIGSLWIINKGLRKGEKIVAEGVQKVKQGMPVVPKPFVQQENAGVKQPATIGESAAAGKR